MHDPFEMLLHRVFAEIEAVGDFFVGKAEHEVNDDHLLAFREVIVLLDIDVGTRRWFVELLHDDEDVPVADYRRIWDTYSAE